MTRLEVKRLLNAQFDCSTCHASGSWISVGRHLRRQNSRIFGLRCARCQSRIVAKASRSDAARKGARVELQREYETLCTLQRVFPQDEHFGTLVALGYLEASGRGVLITRHFHGADLSRHLRLLDEAGVQDACHAAGRWLRKLHGSDASCEQATGMGWADKLDYLTVTYGESLRRDREALAACQCLAEVGPRLGTRKSRPVRLHGDFKPQNMLCDGTRYIGLDIQWRSLGPAIYDLAPFLNHLWLDGHTFGTPNDHSYPARESALLAGYGCEDNVCAVHWAQLYFALCYLGRYRRQGYLTAAYARWRIGPLVRKLVTQLGEAF